MAFFKKLKIKSKRGGRKGTGRAIAISLAGAGGKKKPKRKLGRRHKPD